MIIKNIRSYPEATLRFSQGINVIVGENNSGKSTIIRLIDRLQGANHGQHTFVRNGENEGHLFFGINDVNPKYYSDDHVKRQRLTDSRSANFSIAAKPNLYKVYKSTKNNSSKRVRQASSGWVEFSGFPDEEPRNEIYACYSRRSYYDSQISEENTRKIRQDMGNLTARLQLLTSGSRPRNREFREYCNSILGFEPGPIAQGRTGGNQFSIGIYTDDTTPIFFDQMGQGVAQVLALLTILCTQENKIILLEEIENDLHPRALKSLLNIIEKKSNKNQFIISTHSNIVLKQLGSLPSSKIFKTSWAMTESKGHSIPQSTIQLIENDPQSRLSVLQEMGYDVIDFDLWAGYLLFEESTSELFVKRYFIPTFFPRLTGRICTVAAKGVDDVEPKFKAFINLFVYVHLTGVYRNKAWTIVDGDEAGQKVTDDLRNTFKAWGNDHFILLSKFDFELYYPERFQGKVQEVLAMKKGRTKQAAKVKLREEVLSWAIENKEIGRKEFEQSAAEVIQIIQNIERDLLANL